MPSLELLLCKFTATTNNMISTFLHTLHKESPWLLSIFALTSCVLILWFWAATIKLPVSLFKSSFWGQVQHWSLLTSLAFLKYWPCITFFSQSPNLFSIFDLFKILVASKASNLSPLAACINLSSLPWTSLPNLLLLTQYNSQQISNLFLLLF